MHSLRALALALPLAACGAGGTSGPRSAVLITLDTTSPTALDLYGKDRGVTPALGRFAAESVVYENAWSVAPLTLPAHSSMMTGLYPPRHTVRDNGFLPLPRSAETVAERAREAGYRTAAFIAASVLAPEYGLDQGFEVYQGAAGKQTGVGEIIIEHEAQQVTESAVRWLDGRQDGEPFFLWVHYFDPHWPYEPSEQHLAQASGRPYLGEVSAMDEGVGNLLARLALEPDWDDMLVIVVADHGESHGKHEESAHGILVYDATLRVPLLVRWPRGEHGGTRSPALASVVDVGPTLLDGIGLSPLDAVDGRSLLLDDASPHDGIYLESYTGFLNLGWSPLVAWVDGQSKYVHGTQPELYDLSADPNELQNLFSEEDPRVLRGRAAIGAIGERPILDRDESEQQVVAGAEELAALGYAASASPLVEIPSLLEIPPGLPAPRERMEEWHRVNTAFVEGSKGKRGEAIRVLQDVVASNPRSSLAATTLARFLVETGRAAEALAPLEGLLEHGLDGPKVRKRFAAALATLGRYDEALEHVERAEEMRPGDPNVAELRQRCEQFRKAARDR